MYIEQVLAAEIKEIRGQIKELIREIEALNDRVYVLETGDDPYD